MKAYLVILIIVFTVKLSVAQVNKTEKLNTTKPFFVLFSHNQTIVNADTLKSFHDLPSSHIKSINVLKDSAMVKKYGSNAKDGVIEIYLDDKKYPMALDSLKKATYKIIPKTKYLGKMIQG